MDNIILDGHKLTWHKDRVDAWLNGVELQSLQRAQPKFKIKRKINK